MALSRFFTRVRAVGGVADVTEYADAGPVWLFPGLSRESGPSARAPTLQEYSDGGPAWFFSRLITRVRAVGASNVGALADAGPVWLFPGFLRVSGPSAGSPTLRSIPTLAQYGSYQVITRVQAVGASNVGALADNEQVWFYPGLLRESGPSAWSPTLQECADATRYGPGSFRSGLFAGVEAVYFPYRECAFKAYGNASAVG